jgi:hypothetical protein
MKVSKYMTINLHHKSPKVNLLTTTGTTLYKTNGGHRRAAVRAG